ncbi:MAG: single-stranded DNA-binding protein [Bacteroidetes bacterium]|nr:single-stranded DNA-binding protein [Bacteroidota bacterium]
MINVVALAGNAVGDPTVRLTNSGKKVATFRLAVNNPLSEKEVLFIDVDTWEKQAEFVEKFVKKGNLLSVVGRLKQDTWEKDGQKRSSISVITERINFVNSGKKKDEQISDNAAPAPRAANSPAKTYTKSAAKSATKPAAESDDDIPI